MSLFFFWFSFLHRFFFSHLLLVQRLDVSGQRFGPLVPRPGVGSVGLGAPSGPVPRRGRGVGGSAQRDADRHVASREILGKHQKSSQLKTGKFKHV